VGGTGINKNSMQLSGMKNITSPNIQQQLRIAGVNGYIIQRSDCCPVKVDALAKSSYAAGIITPAYRQ